MKIVCRCQACRPNFKVFAKWVLGLIGLMTLMFALTGCGRIPVPCVPGITCPAPKPSPTPTPSPSPSPSPTPTPSPSPTPVPDRGDDPLPCYNAGREAASGEEPKFDKDVNSAITFACPFRDCPSGTFVEDWKLFINRTRWVLQEMGYSASYDWAHGDDGLGSELSIWKDGRIESYQIVTSRIRARRPPGAFRWAAKVVKCDGPGPEPACDLVVTEEHHVRFKIADKTGAAGARWLDLTPEYFYGVKEDGTNAGPCGDPNTGAPRRWCDLGVDGGPQGIPCQEKLVGTPQWLGSGVELESPFRGNPFLARIVQGSGWVTVCGERLLTQGPENSPVKVCLNWEVK